MRIYKNDSRVFYRNTRKRIVYEALVLILISAFFWSNYSEWLPAWIKLVVLVVFAAYILLGVALYPRAKAAVESFSISLSDDAVIFPSVNGFGRVPYKDITIVGKKTKNDEINSISILTRHNGKIDLNGLDDMTGLYNELLEKGVKEC